jgi:two-component system, LuxR family, response regulator FixJ
MEEEGEAMAEEAVVAVVDDDQSVRMAIKRLINSIGLSAKDFASAEDFLESGEYNEADCLILDVRLPGMSGLELQSYLVAYNRQVPIIFISAHGDELTRSQALKAGAVDFLQKPFREQSLIRAISACGGIDPDQSH